MKRTPTRSPAECCALANRQLAGEDLGFSDAFVKTWASAGTAPKVKLKEKSKPTVLPKPTAPADAEPHWTEQVDTVK